jgi:hypothetical protein
MPRLLVRLVAGLLLGAAMLVAPGRATAQIYALPRPDTSGGPTFGVSVAIDGDRVLVGASGENVCGANAGAAYVYERTKAAGPWTRTARLVPDDCRANAFFGEKVDLSGDRAIVSASSDFFAREESNAAYVFERDSTGTWRQTARLTGATGREEGLFGAGVALDGDRAVVTTSGSPDARYGGAAYVFEYDAAAGRWRRAARLTASQGVRRGVMGGTVALDGDRLAVAASTYLQREPGSVYLFERDTTGTWVETDRLGGVDDFFISLSLSGPRLLVGESRAGGDESGAAVLYRRTPDGTWEGEATLRPSTPYESGAFGSTVSLEGDWALVTGYDEQLGQDVNIDRVVYAFRRRGGAWPQRTIIDIGEVAFGAAIDQSRGAAVISSVPDGAPGAAYVVALR